MKINLGTTSDISNVKTGLKPDAKTDKADGDSDSFFSKLASLFSGDSSSFGQVKSTKDVSIKDVKSAEAVTADGDVVDDSVIDSDTQIKKLTSEESLKMAAESGEADETKVLADKDKPASSDEVKAGAKGVSAQVTEAAKATEATQESKTKLADTDAAGHSAVKKEADVTTSDTTSKTDKTSYEKVTAVDVAKSDSASKQQNASQVMDEGKQVLHRLQEASATLAPGKSLPQDGNQSVSANVSQKDAVIQAASEAKPATDASVSVGDITAKSETDLSDVKQVFAQQHQTTAAAMVGQTKLDQQSPPVDGQGNEEVPSMAVPSGVAHLQKPELSQSVDNLTEESLSPGDVALASAGMTQQVSQAMSLSSESQTFVPSDLQAVDTLPPDILAKLSQGDKANVLSQHEQLKQTADQPGIDEAMYFAPGVVAGAMNQNSDTTSVMYVDNDGQMIDLSKLDKAELEQLAHKQGKTVPQLLSSAMQMNVTQHQQSQVMSMQMPDRQNVDSLNSQINMAQNPAMNNVAMSEAAAQMSKDMNKTFDLRNGFDPERRLDIRDLDGDKLGKDSHITQHLSAMSGQTTQSLSQINRADIAQAQAPVQVNRDTASDELAERVNMMLSKNLKNIDIRLDPPDLGKVHIRMHMNGDTTSVQFTVASHHARDALENSMPRLREMLSQQGVQVGDTAVQHQSAGQQQNGYAASERGQGQQNGQAQNGSSALNSGFGEENNESDVTLRVNVPKPQDGISYYA